MANTKDNVSVGKPNVTGGVFWAPLGTLLPTDASSPLAEGFKPWGYISEEGLTATSERSSNPIKAWGGEVVKNATSEYTEKYSFTAIETNEEVLKGYYGEANVSGTMASGLTIKHTDNDLEHHVFVFETIMDDGHVNRKVLGDAQVVETGEISYKDGEVIAYPVTIQAFEHEGAYVMEYIAKVE